MTQKALPRGAHCPRAGSGQASPLPFPCQARAYKPLWWHRVPLLLSLGSSPATCHPGPPFFVSRSVTVPCSARSTVPSLPHTCLFFKLRVKDHLLLGPAEPCWLGQPPPLASADTGLGPVTGHRQVCGRSVCPETWWPLRLGQPGRIPPVAWHLLPSTAFSPRGAVSWGVFPRPLSTPRLLCGRSWVSSRSSANSFSPRPAARGNCHRFLSAADP